MSVIVRGTLGIIIILLGISLIIYQFGAGVKFNRRCYHYLIYLSMMYPLMDTGISRFDIQFSPINVLTIIFCIINFKIFKSFITKKFLLISIFIVIASLSALLSEYKLNSILSVYTYLNPILIFFIALNAARYKGISYLLQSISKYIVFWIAIFALIQFTIDPQFSILASHKEANDRLCYCFIDPQTAGAICATLAVLYINFHFHNYGKYNIPIFLLMVFLTVSTGSKSSSIGLLLGVSIAVFYTYLKPKHIFAFLSLVCIISFTYNIWSTLPVFKRFNEFDNSLNSRQDVYWAKGFEVYNDNSVIGIGPGNFMNYNKDNHLGLIHKSNNNEILYASQPESGYILIFDEFGIFALLLIIIWGSVFKFVKKGAFNTSLIIPWLFSFISLYNLSYKSVSFVVALMYASIYFYNKQLNTYYEANNARIRDTSRSY